MRRKLPKGFDAIARRFLLLSVLAGIFFSNGEGVYLLPFPVTTENRENSSTPFRAESKKSYTLSVHNAGSHSLSQKSKFQKNVKDLAGAVMLAGEGQRLEFSECKAPRNYSKPRAAYPSDFLIKPSDRAPPTV